MMKIYGLYKSLFIHRQKFSIKIKVLHTYTSYTRYKKFKLNYKADKLSAVYRNIRENSVCGLNKNYLFFASNVQHRILILLEVHCTMLLVPMLYKFAMARILAIFMNLFFLKTTKNSVIILYRIAVWVLKIY